MEFILIDEGKPKRINKDVIQAGNQREMLVQSFLT